MELTLSIFYYVYLMMVAVFMIFSILIIYHLLRFGYMGLESFVIVRVYVLVVLAILIISWQSISLIDWKLPVEFSTSLSTNL